MATLTVTVPDNSQNIQGVAVIKAPLERVFEAHTNAELFKQWFGRGNDMTVHHFDARTGGAWHITERSTEGGMVQSGMEAGWKQGLDAMERLLRA